MRNKELPYRDTERHHLLYNRFLWESSVDLKRLRQTKELIVPMKIDPHKRLHRAIEQVPVPDRHMVRRINKEFYPARNDPLGTMDNLVESVRLAQESTYASYQAVQLGDLVVNAIMLQKPFVEDAVNGEG